MKKLLLLLVSILISFNSYGETKSYYYSNGQIESEINYKDGKEDGKTTYWNGEMTKSLVKTLIILQVIYTPNLPI